MAQSAAAEIAATLNGAARVVLATHADADGDAVGSVLALAHALRARRRTVLVWPIAAAPRRYRFLPAFEEFGRTPVPVLAADDVVVALDSADVARLPAAVVSFWRAGGALVNIDHHATNGGFGTVSWLEPAAPAAAALVWRLLGEMGGGFPEEAALCLYVGLVTDTGNFTYSNTNAWAFEMATDLMRRGVSPAAVERELYGRFSLARMNLLGAALAGMKSAAEGAIIYMIISREAVARAGAADDETEGMVDFTRRLDGCRIGILFRELADGGVKVSFRAADGVDVRPLATAHGGGGHAAAAGCRVDGRLADVVDGVVAETAAWLSRN